MNNILKLVNMEARKVKVRNEETEEIEEITELQQLINRNRLDDSARVARCRRHLPMRNSAMRRRLHQQGDCDSL